MGEGGGVGGCIKFGPVLSCILCSPASQLSREECRRMFRLVTLFFSYHRPPSPRVRARQEGDSKREKPDPERTFSQIFADFRWFPARSVNQGIWESQICAENRRKPQIFAGDRRKPQIFAETGYREWVVFESRLKIDSKTTQKTTRNRLPGRGGGVGGGGDESRGVGCSWKKKFTSLDRLTRLRQILAEGRGGIAK